VGESEENLAVMKLMDEYHLEHPTYGVLQMKDYLFLLGLVANHKRIRRLLRLMGIMALYPKRNLSKLGLAKYIRPYLLKRMKINRPNKAWCVDISYIPMAKGFMYLTAIMDIYSRYIVGWGLFNTLDAQNTLDILKQAIAEHGKPKVINSDQGSQFTCALWVEYLEKEKIKISMDGKGRATDNIFIERFWRTIKQDYVYRYPEPNGTRLYIGLNREIDHYNTGKPHQGIDHQLPIRRYKMAS